jgi:hypothetical protein
VAVSAVSLPDRAARVAARTRGRGAVRRADVSSDLYVLALPLAQGQRGLAVFAFLGGLSAATSMVIVATLA